MFIDTLPGVPPIAQQPYWMALVEVNKLKTQLQELLDKGLIPLSNSLWGVPLSFVTMNNEKQVPVMSAR